LIGTGAVVAIHLLGRPLGRIIDRDNDVEDDEGLQPYLVQVICRPRSEKMTRAEIVQHASSNDMTLRGVKTTQADADRVTVSAHVLIEGHHPARLERLVAELSLQPGIYAVEWYAGDKPQD
jgi:putative Mg2+ transporter-C (MgtC) family protein